MFVILQRKAWEIGMFTIGGGLFAYLNKWTKKSESFKEVENVIACMIIEKGVVVRRIHLNWFPLDGSDSDCFFYLVTVESQYSIAVKSTGPVP